MTDPMPSVDRRKCKLCGESKPLGEFYGRASACKTCVKAQMRVDYATPGSELRRRTKAKNAARTRLVALHRPEYQRLFIEEMDKLGGNVS